MTRRYRPGSWHSDKHLRETDARKAAACLSITALRLQALIRRKSSLRSWSPCSPTYWLAIRPPRQPRCCTRRELSQSCSLACPIQWAATLWRASRDRAAARPASLILRHRWSESGSKCSSRSRRASGERRSYSIPRLRLVNPAEAAITETTVRDVQAAARAMGLQIRIVNASNSREIVAAFAMLASERPDAIFVGPGSLMLSRRVQLAHLATRHAIPAVYPGRIFADVGGLMSYGPSLTDAYRQVGVYVGRILKGAKPSDLPVLQPSKFELIINAETARMLGLTVPDKLLVAADVVIE